MPQLIESPIKPTDYLMGTTLSIGSAVMCMLPESANFVGKADVPSYTPVRWRHIGKTVDAVGGTWIEYPGASSSGRTPANYGLAALILVDREEMDRAQASGRGGRHAAAYKLGTTTMMGSSSKYEIFGLENENDQDYKFAMRIGKGPLVASAGLHKYAPGGIVFHTAFIYDPLKRGVRKGPTMTISEVPSSVPLL